MAPSTLAAAFALFKRIRWFNLSVLALTPLFGFYGIFTTRLTWQTALFSLVYYYFTFMGITAGYHRLWSHRSYVATWPLQLFLSIVGAGAVQGSIKWWARGHRSHHRYTDTDLDPYSAPRGLFYTHIGWQIVKPTIKPGTTDFTDLSKSKLVQFQHKYYFIFALFWGYAFPPLLAWYFWNDAWGGWYYAGLLRMTVVHHGVFAVNSIAHAYGDTPYDDKLTPRDNTMTALLTLGEGYHNFHHEFPMDYRNAIKWYQYDPTKWFIYTCSLLGLTRNLNRFPDNEIKKGELSMQLKKLKTAQDNIVWPAPPENLPIVEWETFVAESKTRNLVIISGYIHDVSDFMDSHPGGRAMLKNQVGKDATAQFYGGAKNHSNAAHNLLSMMRVGILHGGVEIKSASEVTAAIKSGTFSNAHRIAIVKL